MRTDVAPDAPSADAETAPPWSGLPDDWAALESAEREAITQRRRQVLDGNLEPDPAQLQAGPRRHERGAAAHYGGVVCVCL